MFVQFNIVCDAHSAPVISAGDPTEIFKFDPDTHTYDIEIDPANLYCTSDGFGHSFVIELNTSDGVAIRVPMPKASR